MFRISQYMQQLVNPTEKHRSGKPTGPVVIWNLIRRCNLTCKHCYSISADIDFKGELSTDEVCIVMDDLMAGKGKGNLIPNFAELPDITIEFAHVF